MIERWVELLLDDDRPLAVVSMLAAGFVCGVLVFGVLGLVR